MALDTKTFRTRTITAIVFAIVMLAGLLWNQWSFIVLFIIIHFGGWYEFFQLANKIFPNRYLQKAVLALLYITLPIALLIIIRMPPPQLDDQILKVIPCGIIFSLWVNDTMAYISGSLLGKTPLSGISPKKTIEGTLGGIILCVATITLTGWATGYYRVWDWLFISLITAVAGTVGDLLESKLKRMAGVKDSGTFMPGHGGFLDRFDSLLVAVPFVFVYYAMFMS